MKMVSPRTLLLLWCVVAAAQVFCSTVTAASMRSATTAPTTNATTSSAFEATSASGTISEASATDAPTGTVAAATTEATSTPSATVNTAYVCSGDEVARLKMLNANNPYLQSTCSSSAGLTSYVFPFNGELTYAQMVAMSRVSACGLYFRAVLLVQLSECEVANVYVRTTAETVLQLANTSGSAPSEVEVTAAGEVRKNYNLALREGNGSASYAEISGASSLSWNVEGDTIDTTASASVDGQLLLSSDLHVIGTFFASSDSATTEVDDSRDSQQIPATTSAAATVSIGSSCLAGAIASVLFLMH